MKTIDKTLCPLCNKNNDCDNIKKDNLIGTCWCRLPDITFSKSVIDKVPDALKNKACICKVCALSLSPEFNS